MAQPCSPVAGTFVPGVLPVKMEWNGAFLGTLGFQTRGLVCILSKGIFLSTFLEEDTAQDRMVLRNKVHFYLTQSKRLLAE